MKITIKTVGILDQLLPSTHEIIEGKDLSVQEVLNLLVNKYGNHVTEELYNEGNFRKDLSILINGRNVLSMPNKFQTVLKDRDEMIITTQITGG
ncbi:MAG: MoaD/ThiS family protein [Promethearchaeota archaeon]